MYRFKLISVLNYSKLITISFWNFVCKKNLLWISNLVSTLFQTQKIVLLKLFSYFNYYANPFIGAYFTFPIVKKNTTLILTLTTVKELKYRTVDYLLDAFTFCYSKLCSKWAEHKFYNINIFAAAKVFAALEYITLC